MKLLFLMAISLSPIAFSDALITITGEGQDWGYTSIDAAKENAISLAQEACEGRATQVGEWSVQIIAHKEGMFRATATSEFNCAD